MKKTILNQVGDTIIEVLIALTVISLAIGVSYSVANRSLKSARQSQERLEALKLVEGQIEQLKALSYTTDLGGVFSSTGTYCLNDGVKTPNPPLTIPSLDSDNLSDDPSNPPQTYHKDCVKGLYHLTIATDGADEFTIVARWFSFGNLGKEEVNTKYKLYHR